jgi:hypothetical protein
VKIAGHARWGEAPKVCPEIPHRRALQQEKMIEDCAGTLVGCEVPKVCPGDPSTACITSKREDDKIVLVHAGGVRRQSVLRPHRRITSKREDE